MSLLIHSVRFQGIGGFCTAWQHWPCRLGHMLCRETAVVRPRSSGSCPAVHMQVGSSCCRESALEGCLSLLCVCGKNEGFSGYRPYSARYKLLTTLSFVVGGYLVAGLAVLCGTAQCVERETLQGKARMLARQQ